jgi:cytochrome P450
MELAGSGNLRPINDNFVVPAHVDPQLVVDFDYLHLPGLDEHGDVYRAWRTLHAGPDIVWTPRYGGHWILTRGEDIKWAQETHEILSHEEIAVPRGSSPYMPPITVDPPETSRYRAVLNPSFTKRKVAEIYEQRTRALTVQLIEDMKPRGRCEFVREFARVMPVCVFLSIVDLPLERREEFLAWGAGMSEPATRAEYEQKITGYLAQILDQRATEPGDDLLSDIAAWRKNPRFREESEVVGMAMLVFSGGLDTVAAALSFAMHELARRPELQVRLREEPAVIPAAVEEFLRRNAVANTARLVKQKCERKGACLMPGDLVMVPVALSGMDEQLYERPLEVDFDRGPVAHNTFGNGPHRCIGEHLARMELRVFFEEWFGQMPQVRVDPATRPWSHGGSVEGMSSLELIWDP